MKRITALTSLYLVLVTGVALPVFAQDADSGQEPPDPAGRPTEYGIRFTPGMARGIARQLTKNIFVQRYELDEAKADEATELMARRIMHFAHQNQESGQDLIEFFATEMFERTDQMGLPKGIAQGIGTRMLPMMPGIREMANGIMQDVRPMLDFKQQIKLTGEIAMMNVALDAFEKNMKKWSEGKSSPMGNPFESDEQEIQRDENGESKALADARRTAEARSARLPTAEWEQYVEQAKKYYELDPSQAAAADSLLRDYTDRARIALGGEEAWRAAQYQNRLWWSLSIAMPGQWSNGLHMLLERRQTEMLKPIEALGEDLKRRIDEIPTLAQREAADRRIEAALAEKGLVIDEPEAAVQSSASGGEDTQ